MVQRRDLNAPPGRKMADIVRQLREQAEASKTGAAGVKDLGENGDVVWDTIDENGQPAQKSVKRFQVELDDTTAQAEALAEKLRLAEELIEQEQERLDAARELLDSLDMRVDDVVDRPFTTRGAAPPKGAPMGTQWVTPQDHLYVRVPCEEVPDGV
ncbi:MAG: hypothetical protein ACTH6N_04630 [Brachybacterium tyrofermentans]|uniref:hypothetical protein n=1 Tax=Brachybacterium tyrofermentans TaxID=47848 RepID=UPI00186668BC|nr:hypothetical protein [Brachybacterium tyrofermentans]